MKKFAVIPNLYKDPDLKISNNIADLLKQNGRSAEILTNLSDAKDLDGYDCAVVLGGDGTILDVAKKASYHDIPVAGVNLGRVGYLSSVEADSIYKLVDNNIRSLRRKRMMAELLYNGNTYTALNDVVFCEQRASKMISLSVSTGSNDPSEYNCTSLIFSTPTGSSGYNMSAGGPVIDPELDCLTVTPVCPHTGTSHCFVYNDSAVFNVKNISSKDKNVMISIDGSDEIELGFGDTVTIRKSKRFVTLLKFDDEPFSGTLLRKIKT